MLASINRACFQATTGLLNAHDHSPQHQAGGASQSLDGQRFVGLEVEGYGAWHPRSAVTAGLEELGCGGLAINC